MRGDKGAMRELQLQGLSGDQKALNAHNQLKRDAEKAAANAKSGGGSKPKDQPNLQKQGQGTSYKAPTPAEQARNRKIRDEERKARQDRGAEAREDMAAKSGIPAKLGGPKSVKDQIADAKAKDEAARRQADKPTVDEMRQAGLDALKDLQKKREEQAKASKKLTEDTERARAERDRKDADDYANNPENSGKIRKYYGPAIGWRMVDP